MIDPEMAERIRLIIREKGGYDHFSERTNINRQTLLRIATAKTEPKISQVTAISLESGVDLKDIVYGKETNDFLQAIQEEFQEEEAKEDFYSIFASMRKKLNDRISRIERDQYDIQKEYEQKLESLRIELEDLKKSK